MFSKGRSAKIVNRTLFLLGVRIRVLPRPTVQESIQLIWNSTKVLNWVPRATNKTGEGTWKLSLVAVKSVLNVKVGVGVPEIQHSVPMIQGPTSNVECSCQKEWESSLMYWETLHLSTKIISFTSFLLWEKVISFTTSPPPPFWSTTFTIQTPCLPQL